LAVVDQVVRKAVVVAVKEHKVVVLHSRQSLLLVVVVVVVATFNLLAVTVAQAVVVGVTELLQVELAHQGKAIMALQVIILVAVLLAAVAVALVRQALHQVVKVVQELRHQLAARLLLTQVEAEVVEFQYFTQVVQAVAVLVQQLALMLLAEQQTQVAVVVVLITLELLTVEMAVQVLLSFATPILFQQRQVPQAVQQYQILVDLESINGPVQEALLSKEKNKWHTLHN
jgi:hypothetical protein